LTAPWLKSSIASRTNKQLKETPIHPLRLMCKEDKKDKEDQVEDKEDKEDQVEDKEDKVGKVDDKEDKEDQVDDKGDKGGKEDQVDRVEEEIMKVRKKDLETTKGVSNRDLMEESKEVDLPPMAEVEEIFLGTRGLVQQLEDEVEMDLEVVEGMELEQGLPEVQGDPIRNLEVAEDLLLVEGRKDPETPLCLRLDMRELELQDLEAPRQMMGTELQVVRGVLEGQVLAPMELEAPALAPMDLEAPALSPVDMVSQLQIQYSLKVMRYCKDMGGTQGSLVLKHFCWCQAQSLR